MPNPSTPSADLGGAIMVPPLCSPERLLDVLMQESRLYLIFEFLSMDLKKYLDSIPSGQYMDPMLVKVKHSALCF